MKAAALRLTNAVKFLAVLTVAFTLVYFFHTHEIVMVPKQKSKSHGNLISDDGREADKPMVEPLAGGILKNSLHLNMSSEAFKSKEFNKTISDRFSTRLKTLQMVCFQSWTKDFKILNPVRSKNTIFGVDHLHWCSMPFTRTPALETAKNIMASKRKESVKISSNSRKTFVIVTEPYFRMLTTYVNTIVLNSNLLLNRYIIQTFRPKARRKDLECGTVSFPEFVKYFIHSQTTGKRKEDHFVPMYELCSPCEKSFDFIVHMETMKEEISYIVGEDVIDTDIKFSGIKKRIRNKARVLMSKKGKCESWCKFLSNIWWSFQLEGLISWKTQFPLGDRNCDSINRDEFVELIWDSFFGEGRRHSWTMAERRQSLVEQFLQVSLEDRMKVRDILTPDFRMHGYKIQPDDLFPELARKT